MIFSKRLESSEARKMPGCLRPLVLYLEVMLMIFWTRLESSSNMENAWLAEATSPIPGGVADDLLDKAGVL
jgi:hypothetical protein